MAGLEVDAIEAVSAPFSHVVVGHVMDVNPHPAAERLCVASVSDGTETYQVVCGAPNCRKGLKVAFARLGACLQGDDGKVVKIKKTKLRGVESFGMLCSGKELGLSEDAEGILEFSEDAQIGSDVGKDLSDEVFDISLTPNLAHCLSIIGVARELAAQTGASLRLPRSKVVEDPNDATVSAAAVLVANQELCPRYTCRVIKNITLGPSPSWMQQRLELCGVRAINNVVDVTNYVLLEMGQPLHAFDYDKVAGHQILVRCANDGERFYTLDGVERTLTSESLLICDEEKPVALGGIMGGLNSEVGPQTTNLLLESAYFQRTNIRRTSRKLGLSSESSIRFERGCDPNNVIGALDRAAALIQEFAGGTVCQGVIDVKEYDFPEKVIQCRLSRVNAVLGTELGLGEVEKIFQHLDFRCQSDDEDLFSVQVPTYRVDIEQEIDLIEEVARIYGYNNVPRDIARYQSSQLSDSPIFLFERMMRSRLVAEGLQEFLTSDLISPEMVAMEAIIPSEVVVKVINPTSVEQSVLRPSLLSGLLQVVKYNIDHGIKDISAFEVGRIHFKREDQYTERSMAAIVLSGHRVPRQWDAPVDDVDFFDLKGILENLFRGLGIHDVVYQTSNIASFHTGRQATIHADELELGACGEVHPATLRKLDVSQRIFFAVLDLHEMMQLKKDEVFMKSIAEFPGSSRDWTITLDEQVPVADVSAAISEASPPLLEDVTLLALYQDDKLGDNRKNVTFRFLYRDLKKTIAQETVEKTHNRLMQQVCEILGDRVKG